MSLIETTSIALSMKPCSMASFKQPSTSEIHYAVACYEQDVAGNYVGEIKIFQASDVQTVKKVLPMTGGVFRIYDYPDENLVYAVTTDGTIVFINAETFETQCITIGDDVRPYFTDGSLLSTKAALSDNVGNIHVVDRGSGTVLSKERGHCLRKVGNLECPAWSVAWTSEFEIASVGDDGRLNIWDTRASPMNVSAFSTGPSDDGLVFVKVPSKDSFNSLLTGGYDEKYCVWDVRQGSKPERIITTELTGGVWHVDDSLHISSGLQAVACMQGGFVILNDSLDIIAKDDHSNLTYGVAIHQNGKSNTFTVSEVEFDDRKLNQYLLTL